MTAATTERLYCFSMTGNDPHEVQIELSPEDVARWEERKRLDRELGLARTWSYGGWITVTDQDTGDEWEVRAAPCGLGCRCAAQARDPDAASTYMTREWILDQIQSCDQSEVAEAIEEAHRALEGDSNDAEHDALYALVEALGCRNERV